MPWPISPTLVRTMTLRSATGPCCRPSSTFRVRRRRSCREPRLAERLERARPGTVVPVCAPAGFGKSVLVADWCRRPVLTGGVAVARRATTTTRSASGVMSPLRSIARLAGDPGIGERRRRPPDRQGRDQRVERARDRRLECDRRRVRRSRPGPRRLPRDRRRATSTPAVRFLLEHAPEQLRVVVVSRADPPLLLARRRARGELTEIRASRPAVQHRRGGRLPRRRDRRHSPGEHCGDARRADRGLGVSVCSSQPCRSRGATMSRRSSRRSPAVTASCSTTSPRRCSIGSPPGCATSCCRPRSSSGCRDRCATRSPGATTGKTCSKLANGRTCSSSPSTTNGDGGATTISSPNCSAAGSSGIPPRPCTTSTGGRPRGTKRTGTSTEAIDHATAAGDPAWAMRLIERHADELLLRREGATLRRRLAELPDGVEASRRLLVAHARTAAYAGRPTEAEALLDAAARRAPDRDEHSSRRSTASRAPLPRSIRPRR